MNALVRTGSLVLPRPELLALDIDGTLLDTVGDLHDAVREAVAAVVASGVHVVLATGRSPWNGVLELAAVLGLPGVHISMQGAVIGDPATGRQQRVRWLSPDAYGEALRFADESGLDAIVGTLDGHRARRVPEGVDFLPPSVVANGSYRQVDDLWDVLGERPVRVFLPTRPGLHQILRRRAQLRFAGTAAVVWSDTSGIEILAPHTNKGEAVAWLAGIRGIGLDAVAAVGDAANDTEMLRVAGRSASMGAAPAHVRDAADIVVPSSDDDGLLDALAWFFPDLAPRSGCGLPALLPGGRG